MKNFFTLLIMLSPVLLTAQNINWHSHVVPGKISVKNVPGTLNDNAPLVNFSGKLFNQKAAINGYSGPGTIVGTTTYDFQTNASMSRRINVLPDGQISCVWTYSNQINGGTVAGTFSDRGTGYAHFDGTSWSAIPAARIEALRTGYAALTNFGDTETVVAHNATAFNTYVSKKVEGTSTWNSASTSTTSGEHYLWPKVATSGKYLYELDNTDSTTFDPLTGVFEPTFFSRSSDQGKTWDIDHILLPGFANRYFAGGGEEYSIDASGPYVACVVGGLGKDITLWKSSDFGQTFTRTLVDSMPVDSFDAGLNNFLLGTDTLLTNDGSVNCIIDNSGNVHVFWGTVLLFEDQASASNVFQLLTLLEGWDEVNKTPVVVAQIPDCNGNGVYDIGAYYTAELMYRAQGLINTPQSGIDANGNIFVTYAAAVDGDVTVTPNPTNFPAGVNYRDIFASYSSDGGVSWNNPVDLSSTPLLEEMYPSIARHVDDNMYILYQEDDQPSCWVCQFGVALPAGVTADATDTVDFMKFLKVPVAQFMTLANSGAGECTDTSLLAVNSPGFKSGELKMYPNPANDGFYINMTNMNIGGNFHLSITDVSGRLVMSKSFNKIPGTLINVSQFSEGVYFVELTSGNQHYIGKLVIKR